MTVTGTRGGVQYLLQGQIPNSYANHWKLSMALRGVDYMMCLTLGLRWSNGTKHRMEYISPRREVIQKYLEGNIPQSVLGSLGLN